MENIEHDPIKRHHFQLARYFLLISIVCIVLASIAMGAVFKQNSIANLVKLGEDNNVNVARVISNYVWPKYRDQLKQAASLQAEPMRAQPVMLHLKEDMAVHADATSILKVKIYNPDGKTLFSTAADQIGNVKKQSKPLSRALAGEIVTKLAFRDTFYARNELLTQRNVLSTYMPIMEKGATSDVVGVIEIYSDVTDLYAGVTTERNVIIASMMIILLVLYAILFMFIYKADRTIRFQFDEKQQDEEKIRHIAYHDGLTGLPNRELYRYKVDSAVEHAKRNNNLLGILFIDLDRFKQINDSLGHSVGDSLLKQVAERLSHCVRGGDTVARQGGDEFTILLEGIRHVDEIVHVCERIVETVAQPYEINGKELFTSASIGVTVYPFDDTDVDNLLKDADTAMYYAKDSGKNHYAFFKSGMKRANLEQMDLERDLRKALEGNEYLLQFQPVVDIRKGEMIGVEALLRWSSQDHGLVSPVKFIPVLEETGVMAIVGEWVLKTACLKARQWQSAGYAPITVAVNISMVQFRRLDFVKSVENALSESQLDPKYLKIELTESMLMDQSTSSIEKLMAVRALGVHVEADDFGTGYSSLSYLKKLPVDILKIDRSFIMDVHKSSDSAAIVTAIMSLAHSLKLGVIAEGVEQIEELKFLSALNCHIIQGYLFSKPLPEDELMKVMADPDFFRNKLLQANTGDVAASG